MFKIAICDDEEIEVQRIRHLISAYMKEHHLVYRIDTFDDGVGLLESDTRFDVIFLDISMKNSNGIETGQQLYRRNRQMKIVYITSFQEYCNEAMNHVHAFAYLNKPIDVEELHHQLEELVRDAGEEKRNSIEIELANVYELTDKEPRQYPNLSIPVKEILYFEYIKSERRILVKMKNRTLIYTATMTEIEEKMAPYGFGICYRGFMVNYGYVVKAKGDSLYLTNGEQIPLARKRAVPFKQELNDYIHRSI